MRKIIIGIFIFVITILALIIFAFNFSRNTPNDSTTTGQNTNSPAEKKSTPTASPEISYTSKFKGVDAAHWGQGTAKINDNQATPTLTLQEDFKVAQGPDLYVYLSPNAAGQELGDFESLGPLKATEGIQEYNLPADYKKYKTVVIWCKEFSVTFATAEFNFS